MRRLEKSVNPAVNGTFFELGKDKAAKGEGGLRFLSAVPKRLWDSDADSYMAMGNLHLYQLSNGLETWERAVHSVNYTCLSWALVKCYVCPSFPFSIEVGCGL